MEPGGIFRQSEAINEALAKTVPLFVKAGRGRVVGWDELVKAGGYRPRDTRYGAYRRRLDRELRAAGLVLRAEAGVGLRILTVAEHIDRPSDERHRKALRQYGRAKTETQCLPDAGLSVNQRVRKSIRIEAATMARKSALRIVKRGAILSVPGTIKIPRPAVAEQQK